MIGFHDILLDIICRAIRAVQAIIDPVRVGQFRPSVLSRGCCIPNVRGIADGLRWNMSPCIVNSGPMRS